MFYPLPEEMARKEGKFYFPYGRLERLKRFDLTYVLNSLNNLIVLNCLNPLKSRSVLPPRPELDSQIACEAAGHDIDESPFTGIHLGIACHVGLEEQAGIFEVGAGAEGLLK